MSTEEEIEKLDLFLYLYATYVMKIDPESSSHPSNVKKDLVEKHGKKQANIGLKMAINDIISDSFSLTHDDVKKIDHFFSSNGAPTLSSMRKNYSKEYSKILKNEKIKKESEYYLIKEIVDCADANITEKDKDKLLDMLTAYENESAGQPHNN